MFKLQNFDHIDGVKVSDDFHGLEKGQNLEDLKDIVMTSEIVF